MKTFLKTLNILILIISIAACSTKKTSDELVVGTCTGFPPYEMLNKNGDFEGFDIDVAQALAKQLGKKLVLKDMGFDALILAVNQGKIDCAMAGMSITETRKSEVAMIHYQGHALTHLPMLFWERIPEGVTTVEDLKKLPHPTVCAQVDSLQAEVVAQYDFLTLKHLENIPDLIMDIKYGKSIATVLEPMVVEALQQENPHLKILNIPLKPAQQSFGHGIVINKNNISLIATVEKAIQELKNDGTIAALEAKWFTKGASHGDK